MRPCKMLVLAGLTLTAAAVQATQAAEPIIVIRPPVAGATAGVLPQDAFAQGSPGNPGTTVPPVGTPNYTTDWNTIPRDADGFIFKSANYASSPGTIQAVPVKITLSAGDQDQYGEIYRFLTAPKSVYTPPQGADTMPSMPCNADVHPWTGGPKNIYFTLSFQYSPPPANAATINIGLKVLYSEYLTYPVKLGVRFACNSGISQSGGHVQFTQDYEITYTP